MPKFSTFLYKILQFHAALSLLIDSTQFDTFGEDQGAIYFLQLQINTYVVVTNIQTAEVGCFIIFCLIPSFKFAQDTRSADLNI